MKLSFRSGLHAESPPCVPRRAPGDACLNQYARHTKVALLADRPAPAVFHTNRKDKRAGKNHTAGKEAKIVFSFASILSHSCTSGAARAIARVEAMTAEECSFERLCAQPPTLPAAKRAEPLMTTRRVHKLPPYAFQNDEQAARSRPLLQWFCNPFRIYRLLRSIVKIT